MSGCASSVGHQEAYSARSKPLPQQQRVLPPANQPIPSNQNYADSVTVLPLTNDYSAQTLTGTYANSFAVHNFIQYMVNKYGFSESYLNGLFSQANRLESVIQLENPLPSYGPAKPRLGSWSRYRSKFLTEAHIKNGVEFWMNNDEAIKKASQLYHVDPEYVVAIIGVETYFGRNIGKTCIFDALTTLAFDTQRRSKFFTTELENFLLMTREEGFEPRQPVGSWAGAMGLGQFMPSSFRRLAVDFNHDGRRDLWHQQDAIGSVAHYFSRSGWRYKGPVAQQTGRSYDASIIDLSTYSGDEYWRIYPNFKVIKSYNNSNKYAMAVHQLAKAIKHQYFAVAYNNRSYPVTQRLNP
ncbi:MAG: lytic murein transglycosylase [Methylococcaceae bacterium]|nr:lytic murein transglycosylase [Methylococcaceae bacterium]